MDILLILLLVTVVVLIVLNFTKVPVSQRAINVVILAILAVLISMHAGWIR